MDTVIWIIFALLVLLLLAAAAVYRLTFSKKGYTNQKLLDDIRKAYGPKLREVEAWYAQQPFRTVHLRSRDGLDLVGYYLPHPDARGAVLFAHGYRGSPKDGAIVARYYAEKGCSVLMICQRAHGESQGKTITFGALERQDCLLWADWLAQQEPGKGILLHGLSMGAATVLFCADKVSPAVKGIVADCGYTSPWYEVAHVLRKTAHLPPYPILPICDLFCRFFGHFSMVQVNAVNTLAFAKVPVLLIHGEADDFVPYAMGQENARACSMLADFISVPGANHATASLVDPDRVYSAMDRLMERVL